MVSKRDGKYVVYPCYFDSHTARPLRRVPKELAVRGPSADEVAKAALALHLTPVLEKGRAHPSRPWEKSGRVLVDVRGEKGALLRQLAEKLREHRGQAHAAAPQAPEKGRRR
ncbi:MAG TPA: signal recognition particle subunit SRP19/SEC65 family protein [Candidatus Thermoplasmatota archaeon]|jgi:signal recognition particle subunit SRP19|nr:signal recognition particle subunit SRP19/SEC65 family protein [Candidatus Thermoplasmatota archaeon]